MHRRIVSFIIAIVLCAGAVSYASAAHSDVAELSAKTGLTPLGNVSYNASLSEATEDLPESYSSADLGHTLGVRLQHYNTCWAFGTLSTFETLLLKNGEDITHFAPQHANFWGTTTKDGTGWQRGIGDGGYSYIALGYLMSWAGPVYEYEFPELTSTKQDYNNLTSSSRFLLNEAIYFNSDASRDSIKEMIYKYGAVVGNFHSDFAYLSNNTSFYCGDSSFTTAQLLGHCISIVGWDDNYSKENFSESLSGTPEHDGAWLVKNSWGEHANNLGGYYWISYEDVWIFSEKFGPSYALTSYEELHGDIKLYQNEVYGATYQFDYLGQNYPGKEIVYMNAFDFDEEHNRLDEVIFESTSLGSDYKIYYIPFDGDKPDANTANWTELHSGTITYTGYICAEIEDTHIPAGKGCIGVGIDNERAYNEFITSTGGKEIYNSIGVDEWLYNGKYLFIPESDYGMSYYMINDGNHSEIKDVMDFYMDAFENDIGGTFVIKALTENEDVQENSTDPTETTTQYTEATTASTEVTSSATEASSSATEVPTSSVETDNSSSTTATDAPETSTTQATSSTVTTTESTSSEQEGFSYLLGDANLDGKINVKDATQVQKAVAMLITLNHYEVRAGDVDDNKNVNVVDATIIQKFLADMEVNYNLGEHRICYHSN